MGKDKIFNPSLRKKALSDTDTEELWQEITSIKEDVLALKTEFRETNELLHKYYSRLAFFMLITGLLIGIVLGAILF